MLDTIQRLVEENKLTFSCHHRINPKTHLKTNKGVFLKRVERSLKLWGNVLSDVECFDCGEFIHYQLEGETLVPDIKECFKQNELVIEIPVPSGELIFDDWLKGAKDIFEEVEDNTLEINSLKNQIQRTNSYAKIGVAHFFVGNTSPDIFQNENEVLVEKGKWDEETDENLSVVDNMEYMGYISTDLWWVTCVDREVYQQLAIKKLGEKRGKEMAEEAVQKADAVIKVEPGTYHLHYFPSPSKERRIYAMLEKIE